MKKYQCNECPAVVYALYEAGECKACFDKKPKKAVFTPKKRAFKGGKAACAECGKVFTRKTPANKFCGERCKSKASNRARDKRLEGTLKGLVEKECRRCGTTFMQKHQNATMCSDACRKAHKTTEAKKRRAKNKAEKIGVLK